VGLTLAFNIVAGVQVADTIAAPVLDGSSQLDAGSVYVPSLSPGEQEQFDAIFKQALANTDKQLVMEPDGTAYVKTGDIPAEWLRDSSAQIRPYLFFAKDDKNIANKIKAVIERQALYMAADPYANAFREDGSVWERKFELDSLSYPILLAWTYWKVTGDSSVFTPTVMAGFDRALETMEIEQDHGGPHPGHTPYTFHPLQNHNPVGHTGMIWSAFRPSDDDCIYNFLIPSEIQAVQALSALHEMETFTGRHDVAARAGKLGAEVHAGIEKFGIINHPKYGRIYAYEVDGLGHANVMDDANIPSLLSIPYFGYASETDPVYAATRKFILSKDNPYFYSATVNGQEMSGVGSPHTPPEMIWPLAQLAEGLTTSDPAEQIKALKMVLASDPGDHKLHESFSPKSYLPNSPKKEYTRPDFGWPNELLVEFALTAFQGRPALPVPAAPKDVHSPGLDKRDASKPSKNIP